jgi:hypothetical protein
VEAVLQHTQVASGVVPDKQGNCPKPCEQFYNILRLLELLAYHYARTSKIR